MKNRIKVYIISSHFRFGRKLILEFVLFEIVLFVSDLDLGEKEGFLLCYE